MRRDGSLACDQMCSGLSGKRILVTGLTSPIAAAIAMAFALHSDRLVVAMTPEDCPKAAYAHVEALRACQLPVHVVADEQGADRPAARLTQAAMQVFHGLDIVVNVIRAGDLALDGLQDMRDLEAALAAKLMSPAMITHVSANRMGLTWTDGLIVNVLDMEGNKTPTVAALLKLALDTVTRHEAAKWAESGVRINAVVALPDRPSDPTPVDAAVRSVLHLVGGNAEGLSGLVLATEMA
ncbi:MAG: SDR family oxidoreductase [Hyphomicrobiaceae bacterium]|nr:SDR family oxidoreductase [Hyphomicrobiaceae bacterium]